MISFFLNLDGSLGAGDAYWGRDTPWLSGIILVGGRWIWWQKECLGEGIWYSLPWLTCVSLLRVLCPPADLPTRGYLKTHAQPCPQGKLLRVILANKEMSGSTLHWGKTLQLRCATMAKVKKKNNINHDNVGGTFALIRVIMGRVWPISYWGGIWSNERIQKRARSECGDGAEIQKTRRITRKRRNKVWK